MSSVTLCHIIVTLSDISLLSDMSTSVSYVMFHGVV